RRPRRSAGRSPRGSPRRGPPRGATGRRRLRPRRFAPRHAKLPAWARCRGVRAQSRVRLSRLSSLHRIIDPDATRGKGSTARTSGHGLPTAEFYPGAGVYHAGSGRTAGSADAPRSGHRAMRSASALKPALPPPAPEPQVERRRTRRDVDVADSIARTILAGFDRHYSRFRYHAQLAKARYEAGDFHAIRRLASERIAF